MRQAFMQHSSECIFCCLRGWRLCETQDGGARKLGSCVGFRIDFFHPALPVDISPSEDDPQVDTASRVDAAVALARLLVRCLRTWRIFDDKKNSGRSHTGKNQLQCPCAHPFPGYFAEWRRSPRRHRVTRGCCRGSVSTARAVPSNVAKFDDRAPSSYV